MARERVGNRARQLHRETEMLHRTDKKKRDQTNPTSTEEDEGQGLRPMGDEDNIQKIKKHK